MLRIPNTTPPEWPDDIPQGRFAAHIHQAVDLGCRIALLGLPDDTGIALNGGRPGAREGPSAFRRALARFGVAQPQGWRWPVVFDAGNIVPAEGKDAAAMLATHQRIREAVSALLGHGLFPIGIGGGHDLTLPFAGAVIDHARAGGTPIDSVLYFDAHLDVRDTPGSGMPFRGLVERHQVRSLVVLGASDLANDLAHSEWFAAHGGVHRDFSTSPESHLAPPARRYVSLDLDVLDAAFAPGVSAMNPCGATPHDLRAWVRAAGRSAATAGFDIMELSPPHDENGRTARLAAMLFLEFLRGFSERPAA